MLVAAASLASCSAADQVNQTTTVQIGPLQSSAPDAGPDVDDSRDLLGEIDLSH